jgi:RNA polymerase sigma-70 factor (ECF subfamily)
LVTLDRQGAYRKVKETGESGSNDPHRGDGGGGPSCKLAVRRPDARVLDAVRRRDPEALGEFFELYFDRLYNVAYRLVGDHARAEDVLQEVFLKVHRAAHQLDPERDPGPWLATLTRNACRERWRREGRRVNGQARSLDNGSGLKETLPAGETGPEDETLRSERERTIAKALMQLPGELREVVVLRDYHGMAHDEIAEVVGARVATVRKRYSRALAGLRDTLKGIIE